MSAGPPSSPREEFGNPKYTMVISSSMDSTSLEESSSFVGERTSSSLSPPPSSVQGDLHHIVVDEPPTSFPNDPSYILRKMSPAIRAGLFDDDDDDGDEATAASPIECAICLEMVSADDAVSSLCCVHYYCEECIGRYCESTISAFKDRLTCPHPGCDWEFLPVQLVDILDAEQLARYKRMQNIHSRNGGFMRPGPFYCLNPSCSRTSPIPHACGRELADNAKRCPTCKTEHCLSCLDTKSECRRNHCTGERSNEGFAIRSKLWAMVHTKKCPRCRVRIQKNKGCSHMTCARCGHYFCWHCGGDLNSGRSHCLKRKAVTYPPMLVAYAGYTALNFVWNRVR